MTRSAPEQVVLHRHTLQVYWVAVVFLCLLHLPRYRLDLALESRLAPLRVATSPRPPPAPVTLVQLPPERAHSPRDLAASIRHARRTGASSLGLELPSWSSSPPREAVEELARALEEWERVVLGVGLAGSRASRRLAAVPEPLEEIATLAYTHVETDLLGNPSELVQLGLTRDRSMFGSAVELLREHRGIPAFQLLEEPGALRLSPLPGQDWPGLRIPLTDGGGLRIDPRYHRAFARVGAEALVARPLPEALSGDRILLFESAPPADRSAGPGSGTGSPTRGEFLASALAALLAGDLPAPLPWAREGLLLVVLSFLAGLLGSWARPRTHLLGVLCLGILWWVSSWFAYRHHALLLPLARPTSLLAALAVAGLLRYRFRPLVGMAFRARTDLESEKEAQAALSLGIKMLQQGQVDASVKYFQKVARIQGSLQDRSKYFLSLVLLRRGETESASTLVSGIDFSSLSRNDTYHLADELERRGALETAHTLFGKIDPGDDGFENVAERLAILEKRLGSVSEEEIAEMMVRKVLDPRFEEIELVGRGGMGFVFRGLDRHRRGEEVALKILSPLLANHEEIRERFLQEARLVERLAHPNIVRIHEVFDKSLPYFSMEFLGTLSVKEILAGVGQFPVEDALELMIQVTSGLEAAHDLGVVHRDIKPDNLMLDDEATVKIIDFGIAKDMDGGVVTGTRKRLGTPEYMSPEQITALPVDLRSDIYSLGIVLYEILTGAPPFTSIQQHISDPLPPLPPELAVPPRLEATLRSATAKSVEQRFSSMADLRGELEEILGQLPEAGGQE